MGQICAQCGQMHPGYPCPQASVQGARLTAINDDELLVGSIVADRYHVGDVLGQGTTGTVFAAEHLSFSRGAALKVLRPRYASPDLIHRVFHGEARTAWRIVHPCLVEVFDVGTLPDGAPFFVMEPLQGETLATRIRRERLSLAAAVDVMMQLLSALEVIHAKDQLLRDLRPQNVFLAQRRGCRPVAKILDFGLARLVSLERVQSEWDAQRAVVAEADTSGGLLAIPYYLSPERTRGEHGLSPSSDLFVISSIFYESLTGERPFVSGTFTGLLSQIARGQPTPLDELRPDVPTDLANLVARALAASPLSRPASAKEMQEELRSIFEGGKRRSLSRMASAPSSMMGVASTAASESAVPTGRDRDPSVVAYSPADQEPHTAPPSAFSTDRPVTMRNDVSDDDYADQTETNRKYLDLEMPSSAVKTPIDDEASADNPQKTMRPPEIGIDVEFEPEHEAPTTSRESELDVFVRQLRAERAARPPSGAPNLGLKEEEETETMQLTPELRARIEQMSRASSAESAPPPPTRRVLKPPR